MHKKLVFYVLFFAHFLYLKVLYLFLLIILSCFDFNLILFCFFVINLVFIGMKPYFINYIIDLGRCYYALLVATARFRVQ